MWNRRNGGETFDGSTGIFCYYSTRIAEKTKLDKEKQAKQEERRAKKAEEKEKVPEEKKDELGENRGNKIQEHTKKKLVYIKVTRKRSQRPRNAII